MQLYTQLHQQGQVQSPEIHFSQKTFGKRTKNRTEDPSMFELLSWSNQSSIQSSDFKKKYRFVEPKSAYLSMISKQPWISQTQENYLNFHANSIVVNKEVFRQVVNYIEGHEPKKQYQKPPKVNKNLVKKNKNQWSDQQGHQNAHSHGNQNQKNKVSQPIYPNNFVGEISDKQNTHKDAKDLRKRPNSAKNICHMNTSKVHTSKQITTTYEDHKFQESKIIKRQQITEQEQQKLIEKFKQTTRWIPNSSFMTYFGKPPFQNYGRGNTKPIDGGLVYGTYLYSHNVHPHRGANCPVNLQSYPVALMKAKSIGKLVPTQPKTICKYLENKINNQKERQYDRPGAIEAIKNTYPALEIEVPDLHGVEKFGGTKMSLSRTKFHPQEERELINNQGRKQRNKRL